MTTQHQTGNGHHSSVIMVEFILRGYTVADDVNNDENPKDAYHDLM